MTLGDAYEVLGLRRGVTEAEVNQAYRHLAMTTHPDVAADKVLGETRMRELNAARDMALEDAHNVHPPVTETVTDGVCPRCDGKKKVKVKKGFSTLEVVCPVCQK